MFTTVIGALLPVVVTLLLGVAAAWHHDFDDQQASVLNRMVMLYALPMLLFAGMVAIPRHQLTGDVVLAAVILATMILSYIVPLVLARYIFGRDLATSALQALAIAAPSFAFVGYPVLGYLFGADAATIPVAISGLVLNLFQFPLSMVLLTIGTAGKSGTDGPRESLFGHVLTAFKQPVVWSPILAFIIMMLDLDIPDPIRQSLELLGKTTGGAALFAAGIILYSHRVTLNRQIAVSVVSRNLVIPALVGVIVFLLDMRPETGKEAVLAMAIPTSSVCVILAVQFKTAEQEIASTLFFSTILSLPTMGLFIWLMGA